MGACCSKEPYSDGVVEDAIEEKKLEDEEEGDVIVGDYGARMRLYGASKYTSMYTQQGRKGINQDAMTVWEVIENDMHIIHCFFFPLSTYHLFSNDLFITSHYVLVVTIFLGL
jgi:hypothetical protein